MTTRARLIPLFLLLAPPGLALGTNFPPQPEDPKAVASAGASAKAYADADANAHAQASQTQTATGGQAVNEGLQQSVVFEQIRQYAAAPDVHAPPAYPTAPCRIAKSVGLSFGQTFSAGAGGGWSELDPDCDRRETARSFAALGQFGAALLILCNTTAAKADLGEACRSLEIPAAGPPAASRLESDPLPPVVEKDTVPCVPTQVMAEREKKLLEGCVRK